MVAVGEWWWVPDEEQCFVPARVTSINGADASLAALSADRLPKTALRFAASKGSAT